jgi:hypothetical protein
MRTIVKATLVVAAAVYVVGCSSNKAAQPEAQKLADNYATSALLALKAIQRDPYVPAKGSELVSRFTQEKIDAADVAATSDKEKNITVALTSVYRAQLTLNQRKEQMHVDGGKLEEIDSRYSQKQRKALGDAWVKMMEAESSGVKSLSETINKCYSDFDPSLRARLTDVPASCSINLDN